MPKVKMVKVLPEDLALLMEARQHLNALTEWMGNLANGLRLGCDAEFNPNVPPSTKAVGELMLEIFHKVLDQGRCLGSCKRMYHCELPAGHEGRHQDGGLSWTAAEDDGEAAEILRLNSGV
jgi:hypothetical protein